VTADRTVVGGSPPPVEVTAERPPGGWWRDSPPEYRWRLVILVLALTLTGMMAVLVAGMLRNDAAINANPVRTTATVLTVSPVTTGIEFVDDTGAAQRPPGGVLYPGKLSVGQRFVVEYARSDATIARVAGRSAVNGIVMPGLVVVLTWITAAPVLWLLSRRERRLLAALPAALSLPRLASQRARLRPKRGGWRTSRGARWSGPRETNAGDSGARDSVARADTGSAAETSTRETALDADTPTGTSTGLGPVGSPSGN
jgi:hypothetical protein